MLAIAHHYDEPVARGGITYRARVYTDVEPDGMWAAWIVFFPVGGGRVISTDRETTQSSVDAIRYWASGLTHTYLHGALDRALSLQPELQLSRELDRLERLEESAELRAAAHEAAAAEARMESDVVAEARERAEERLFVTTAGNAESDARPRKRRTSAKKKR